MTFYEFDKYIDRAPIRIVYRLEELIRFDAPKKTGALMRDSRSFLGKDGYWHVYPIAFGKSQVFIVCPHCGEIHGHSHENGRFAGFRLSHCRTQRPQSYELVEPDGYKPIQWKWLRM